MGGDGQDSGGVAIGVGAEPAGEVGTWDVGQQQVDDDQVEMFLLGGGQALLPGGGLGDLVAGALEAVSDGVTDGVLIVDEQDAPRWGRGGPEGERGDGAAAGVVLETKGGAEGEGGLVSDGQAEPEPVAGPGASPGEPLDRLGGRQPQALPGVLDGDRDGVAGG